MKIAYKPKYAEPGVTQLMYVGDDAASAPSSAPMHRWIVLGALAVLGYYAFKK